MMHINITPSEHNSKPEIIKVKHIPNPDRISLKEVWRSLADPGGV